MASENFKKLNEALQNIGNKTTVDIVWSSDLDIIEKSTVIPKLYKIQILMETFRPNMMAVDGSKYDRWKECKDLIDKLVKELNIDN